MVYPIHKVLLISLVVTLLLVVQSTTSYQIKDVAMQKIEELSFRLDDISKKNKANEVKIAFLEKTNAESKIKIGHLESKNAEQDKEIAKLKTKIVSKPVTPISTGLSKQKGAGIPSSCSELEQKGHSFDGLYLVKNPGTKKIETVFCRFETEVSQELIGNIDVKTKTVLFNVARNSSFGKPNAVIPFEMTRLNEGGAMDLASGVFTVPVSGIYHFEFSGLKNPNVKSVSIFLQVNGAKPQAHVGTAYISQNSIGTYDGLSFTSLIRLKVNDRVNLVIEHAGMLYDSNSHHTQFVGLLVEEDLI